MNSQRMLWNIYAGAVGTLTALAAQKVLDGAWRAVTGEPRERYDRVVLRWPSAVPSAR